MKRDLDYNMEKKETCFIIGIVPSPFLASRTKIGLKYQHPICDIHPSYLFHLFFGYSAWELIWLQKGQNFSYPENISVVIPIPIVV